MSGITRRDFLLRAGIAGGSLAMYNYCLALDLMEPSPAKKNLAIPTASGDEHIVILGGGLAGLAVAYELQAHGYHCTILEASHRLGGRNLTLRHGDLVDELGRPNHCHFDKDPNLYFNAGPARIPGHHRRTLAYCKKFNIPLQVKANNNRLAYFHSNKDFAGKPKRQVEYLADARGFMAELTWKAINKNIFDEPLTEEDREKLLFFARRHGDLDSDGHYAGTQRAGSVSDRMLTHGGPNPPETLSTFLNSNFWRDQLQQSEEFDWAEPLMTPKGGMDKIVEGFKSKIKAKIYLNAQVQSIQLLDQGVNIQYQRAGKVRTLHADYCFNNIPAPILMGIDNNFPNHYKLALAAIRRKDLFKIAFQMKQRFWENEEIYGGITYTDQKIAQIWYPSHDINAEKGVILGAYVWNPKHCEYFANLTLQQRLDEAAVQGDKLHPNYSDFIDTGVSVPWSRMNHMMGCGNALDFENDGKLIKVLQTPESNHAMIGDQISYHPGWQEGAFASIEPALEQFTLKMHQQAS